MSRTINTTIKHPVSNLPWTGGKLEYTLLTPFETATTVYPAETIIRTLDSDGQDTTTLGAPDTGTAYYKIVTPDNLTYFAYIESGPDTDLQTVLTLATTEVDPDAVRLLIDAHAGSYLHEVNVKSHGAYGDNSHDDTAAILAAISAASAGDNIIFPRGTYLLKTSTIQAAAITINKSLRLSGVGAGSIIKTHPSSADQERLFKISADDITIDNLAFDATDNYGGTEIEITTCSRVSVRDCHFTIPAAGVYVSDNVYDLTVTGNHFTGDGYGFIANDPNGGGRWIISNNVVTGNLSGTYGGEGIVINAPTHGFSDAVISNNIVCNIKNVSVSGYGISLTRCSKVTVTGNEVYGCDWTGIHIEDRSTDIVVSGNYAHDNKWAGIDVQPVAAGGCSNILITGNTVEHNCLTPGSNRGNAGIDVSYIGYNSTNITISNNQCINNLAPGIYGLRVYPIQIVGNLCYGNTEGIYADTVLNCLVSGNICKNSTTGAGIHLITFTSGMITANQCFDDQTPKTQTYGLNAGGNAVGARAENNSFIGNLSGAINDTSTGILPGVVMPWLWGATTPGSCVGKFQVFDQAGNSLGWVPVYTTIT